LQTIETKVTLGVHPIELGKRFTFTPQFSFGISHLVNGTTLLRTYHPGLATPGNDGYVFSIEKKEGGLLSTMAGLKTEFLLGKNVSLFMTNDFGFMLGYQVSPISFYNSIGISFKFEKK